MAEGEIVTRNLLVPVCHLFFTGDDSHRHPTWMGIALVLVAGASAH